MQISALMASMDTMMDMGSMGSPDPSMDITVMSPDQHTNSMSMSPATLSGNPDSDFAMEMIIHHQVNA